MARADIGVGATRGRRPRGRIRSSSAATLVVAVVLGAGLGPSATATAGATAPAASVPHVIIDTDLSLYWDDATALGMANVLQQRGQVQILGVMSDIRNTVAVAAIDAIDTAYGHSHIPVGAVADSGADTVAAGYSRPLTSQLPHAVKSSRDVPEAVTLYRRLLAGQPDHSVTIVALGAYTNLAGLLHSKAGNGSALGGRALIAAKVRRLVIEDGLFPNGAPVPLTNAKYDMAAARTVVTGAGWPTPIAWVDGFTGIDTKVGGSLCATTARNNPMRIVYQALFGCGPPGDGDWDGPTMLYAIGREPGLFTPLGQGGAAVMNAAGGMAWQTVAPGRHEVYVHVADQGALNARINQLLEAR
jgi:inosine-uridine preferring nucleoside hydrolase